MRKRLFYLCFERAPDLARLTVAWLEAGEFAFDERSRDLDRPIEDFLDFPDIDHVGWSSQRVAAIGAFFGLHQVGFAERLEDFFKVIFREMLSFCQSMDREGFIGLGQGQYGSESIIGLF